MSRVRQEEEGGQHGDLSKSYIQINNGRVPKGYRGLVKGCIQHQYGAQEKNTLTGIQDSWMVMNLITQTQINTGAPLTGTVTKDSWPSGLFQLNPYATNTGSQLLTSIVQPSQDYAYIHQITGQITLTGLETVAQEVTLYFFKYKKSNTDLQTEWNNVLSGISYGQTAVTQTVPSTGIATYGAQNRFSYGTEPFAHKAIKKMFKLLKKVKHIVEPGSTHTINYRINYNRMISKEMFTASAGDTVAGYTIGCMALCRSQPVYTLGSTTKAMTPGPTDIGWTNTYNVRVSFPQDKRLYAFRSDAGFVGETIAANLSKINDVDAAVTVTEL